MTLRLVALLLSVTLTTAFMPTVSLKSSPSSRHAVITLKEAAARRAWLSKLDVSTFGKERAQVVEVTKEMTKETSVVPEPVAIVAASDDNAAKVAWLSKLDQPKLGVVSEAAAKAAWLNKLDLERSKWGTVGKIVPNAAAPKEEVVSLSSEDAAKQRWLASIEKK